MTNKEFGSKREQIQAMKGLGVPRQGELENVLLNTRVFVGKVGRYVDEVRGAFEGGFIPLGRIDWQNAGLPEVARRFLEETHVVNPEELSLALSVTDLGPKTIFLEVRRRNAMWGDLGMTVQSQGADGRILFFAVNTSSALEDFIRDMKETNYASRLNQLAQGQQFFDFAVHQTSLALEKSLNEHRRK